MPMRDGTEERRAELYAEAVALIRADYSRPLRVEEVAHELATSRRQLQRAFAEAGHTSFRSVVAAVRMQHARALLMQQNVPIGVVAMKVGYPQPAQFAKSFRRHHGVSPSHFRRAVQQDGSVSVLRARIRETSARALGAQTGAGASVSALG